MESLKTYLDNCFLPLGFEAEDTVAGQNYVRQDNGRSIKVHCSRRSRTRYAGPVRYRQYAGHQFQIQVSTPVKGRLSFTTSQGCLSGIVRPINRFAGTQPVTDVPDIYSHLEIWSADPEWATRLLTHSTMKSAVQTLIPDGQGSAPKEGPTSISLKLWPENWAYSMQTSLTTITTQNTAVWLDSLLSLAALAEENPPFHEVEPNWVERNSGKPTFIVALLVIFGLFLLLVFCCMVGMGLVLAMGRTGL